MTDATNKVRSISAVKRMPDPEIVRILEATLELAKKGEVVDLAVIYTSGGSYQSEHQINSDPYGLAGYMFRVQREITDIGDNEED